MTPAPPNPLISVVIPVYNGARYLGRSVRSALTQTETRHEILVVDDGSSDRPGDALSPITDSRLRLLRHATNRGLSAARNTGIQAAQGEFVALLDSDDWWEPTKLEEQLRLFQSDPTIDCVFTDFIHISPEQQLGPWKGGLLEHLVGKGLMPRPVLADGYVFCAPLTYDLIRHTSFMHPSTVVIRRRAFEQVGLFDEALWGTQDLQMWIRLAARCTIGMVDRVLTWIEQRSESVGHQRARMSEDLILLYGTIHRHVPELSKEIKEHIRQFLARQHESLGWFYREQGDHLVSRRHYWASLRHEFKFGTFLRWLRSWLPGRPKPLRSRP
jgi:glycosyltransferase involved in cell wall biosynthesis